MGRLLFDRIVKMDLEGITCKQKDSPYRATEQQSRYRIKVKNSHYSRLEDATLSFTNCLLLLYRFVRIFVEADG